jgi:hypothetical protein
MNPIELQARERACTFAYLELLRVVKEKEEKNVRL